MASIQISVNGWCRNEDVYSHQIQLVSDSRYGCDVVNDTLLYQQRYRMDRLKCTSSAG